MKRLDGTIALVSGATRGGGRGIACGLGEAGATVYCTGRSVRGRPVSGQRRESIEDTAEMVTARGGRGIAVQVDHTVEDEVVDLCARIEADHGRLDLLVNNVWGGDELTEFGTPFWKVSMAQGRTMMDRAVMSHLITSRHAVPMMVARGQGLIVEVTDGDTFGYRGNVFYDLAKMSVLRLAYAMAWELRGRGVTALAVTPGFLRSEAVLDHLGVTEANWQDGAAVDPDFAASETPFFVGRAVAALATDPDVARRAGRVFSSWQLAEEYGFDDVDGRRPHWGRHFAEKYGAYRVADDAAYAPWADGPIDRAHPRWAEEMK